MARGDAEQPVDKGCLLDLRRMRFRRHCPLRRTFRSAFHHVVYGRNSPPIADAHSDTKYFDEDSILMLTNGSSDIDQLTIPTELFPSNTSATSSGVVVVSSRWVNGLI